MTLLPTAPRNGGITGVRHFRPQDFDYDEESGTCICPAGKKLYQNGSNCIHNGLLAVKFQGAQRDCLPCELRDQCLRTPAKTKTRQVCFFRGKADPHTTGSDSRNKRAETRARSLHW